MKTIHINFGSLLQKVLLQSVILMSIITLSHLANATTPAVNNDSYGSAGCLLTGAGGVQCWGDNSVGELGVGYIDDAPHIDPLNVIGLPSNIIQVAGTCALTSSGVVYCWGDNSRGIVSVSSSSLAIPTPTIVSGFPSGVKAITAGSQFMCAIAANNTVYCWGSNYAGQLGTAPTQVGFNLTGPTLVPNVSGVQSISAGDTHACASITSGTVSCWGDNDSGQVFIPNCSNESTIPWGGSFCPPQQIPNLGNVKLITSGGTHNCALTTSATVICWGENYFNTSANSSLVQISGVAGVVSLSTDGIGNTCAVNSSGAVQCWSLAVSTPNLVQQSGFASPPTSVGGDCVEETNGSVQCFNPGSVNIPPTTLPTVETSGADLAVSLTSQPGVKSAFVYTGTISNGGPQTATNAIVTMSLASGVTYSISPSGCTISGTSATCNLGNMAPGEFALSISGTNITPGNKTTTVTVTSSVTNPTPGNNTATLTYVNPVQPNTNVPTLPEWAMFFLAIALAAMIVRKKLNR